MSCSVSVPNLVVRIGDNCLLPDLYPIGSMYAIYGNMDPINIPQMLPYMAYMDPMDTEQLQLLNGALPTFCRVHPQFTHLS